MKTIPTAAEILTYSPTVPVKVAAAYLGESPQSVRERVKEGTLPIGYRSGHRTMIYPKKLVEHKEGKPQAANITGDLKFVGMMMEQGLVTLDEILSLVKRKEAEAN